MAVPRILQKKVLGPKPLEGLFTYLRNQLPPFVAPTNAAAWRREIPRLRRAALEKVFLRGIPRQISAGKPRVVWGEVLKPDPSYVIRKLRYEAYPDYWIPALLYEPTNLRGKVPVVLNPNGHHRGGKAADYKQARCANLARRGIIALNMEFIGMSELEADAYHNNLAHLEVTGMAGVGLFYLALQKGLDVLLSHRHADKKRVAVTGLSGGGWQTIVISALDERVTLSVPVAGYTAIRSRVGCQPDLGDKEQMPADMLSVADYDTLTAMLAPRPALLILNHNDDCCFKTQRARPIIYDAVMPTYKAMGAAGKFATYNNLYPGNHNYGADNRSQLYKFLKRHFALPANTPEQDTHRPDELYTEDQLRVGLPPEQQTMVGLARQRADRLGRQHVLPRTAAQRRKLRQQLGEVIRLPRYKAQARQVAKAGAITQFVLKIGPWALPATTYGDAKGLEPVLTINEQGRQEPHVLPPPDPGPRYHVELLGTGETAGSWLNMSIIDALGQRVLGLQVAQLLAAARWAAARQRTRQVHLTATGWGPSFVALVACAMEPRLFASCTPYLPLTTLRYLMDWPLRYEEAQACFCPGLLEVADVPQIRELAEGVEFRHPGRGVIADTRG